jgi:hypothetical protein
MAAVLKVSLAFGVYPDSKCENVTNKIVFPGVEKKGIFSKISDSDFYVKS